MSVARGLTLTSVGLVAVVLAAGYDPELVAAVPPAAALAKSLHEMLPSALVGSPATAVAPALRPPVAVVVAPVARKATPWRLAEIGTAQAISSVSLRPHFDATVDSVLVADGAEVKAGDVLIKLDPRQIVAQLDGAKAQLAKDEATLEQNERDVARYADLVSRNATPILNLDNARTAATTTRAAIAGDKAAIVNLQVQLDWCTVSAPISGRVGIVNIKAGNIAKASDNSASGVFATINQMSPIYVAFSVPQTLLPVLREAMAAGAEASVIPQGAKKAEKGKLALIDNAVDSNTGTIVVRAAFDNADEALWPGELGNLTLTLRVEPDRVTAPRAAVLVGQNGNYVYVVADGVAHARPIEVDRVEGDDAVIAKGLDGGETVVVDGALLLYEGARVVERDAAKGAS